MKECKSCGMLIHSHHENCPLCGIPVLGGHTGEACYPAYQYKEKKAAKGQRACIILTVSILSLLLFLNLVTFPVAPVLWSLNVAAPVLYVWLLVKNTVQSNLSPGAKTMLNFFGMAGMFVVFDATSGFPGWSVNYVIPFMILSITLVITVIMLKADIGWEKYISYTISLIFIGFIPFLLLPFGITGVLWTAIMCAAYSSCTLLSLYLSKKYVLTEELARRFHA